MPEVLAGWMFIVRTQGNICEKMNVKGVNQNVASRHEIPEIHLCLSICSLRHRRSQAGAMDLQIF